MKNAMWMKVSITAGTALVLLLPLAMIRDIVEERRARRDSVVADIAEHSFRSQRMVGPMLVVPWKTTRFVEITEGDDKNRRTKTQEVVEHHVQAVIPEVLDVTSQVDTSTRSRGIYAVLVYGSKNRLTGHFTVPKSPCSRVDPEIACELEPPVLVMGVDDPRGLDGEVTLDWNGEQLAFGAGPGPTHFREGVHAEVKLSGASATYAFSIAVGLRGMQSLELVPIGKTSSVKMASPWPHPSFTGQFLPVERIIGAKGFEAGWRTSSLATNLEPAAAECVTSSCASLYKSTVGVRFVDPVDLYLKTERALKYGFLYVGATFLLFFLFEILKQLRIHPVQYGLVGTALALFFLLLIALAEHIAFSWAYLFAASGCVLLLGYYVRFVLGSMSRSLGFVTGLGGTYAMLYVLLVLEDHALVLGALLLFALLAVVMVATRRVEWQRLGDSTRS